MILFSAVIYGVSALCIATSLYVGIVSLKFYADDAKNMK